MQVEIMMALEEQFSITLDEEGATSGPSRLSRWLGAAALVASAW